MSNSPLVSYTALSPNHSGKRKNKISKITLHQVAGKISLKTLGRIFAPKSRKASSNYGVSNTGEIGMFVEEKNRAWTSGSAWNDHRAVTVEIVNDKNGGDWSVSDKALEGTIQLCVDICKRNGMKELVWTGDKNGSLTTHDMYQKTVCPGPYLKARMPKIAKEVTKRLKGNQTYYKVGDKGSEVKKLQNNLIKLGYPVGKYGADGSYGPDTRASVLKFQRDNKLSIDGIAGKNTLSKLKELIIKAASPELWHRLYVDGKKIAAYSQMDIGIDNYKLQVNKAKGKYPVKMEFYK